MDPKVVDAVLAPQEITLSTLDGDRMRQNLQDLPVVQDVLPGLPDALTPLANRDFTAWQFFKDLTICLSRYGRSHRVALAFLFTLLAGSWDDVLSALLATQQSEQAAWTYLIHGGYIGGELS